MTTSLASSETVAAAPRYAIYFAPGPDRSLWAFGSAVLGYDASTGEPVRQIVPPGWSSADWHEATAEPRRYGFHATLKAPFRLADGASEADLLEALAEFGRTSEAVHLPGLAVAALGSFVALVPTGGLDGIGRLEAEAVRRFDRFRAPLTPAERTRRRPEVLSLRQRENLDRWGYPFVIDEFRFHMTLTGPLAPDLRDDACAALRELASRHGSLAPLDVDRIALFWEPAGGQGFSLLSAVRLGQP